MRTEEINKAMQDYKTFLGTWPSDMIPDIGPGEGVIVNTDTRNEPGKHWVAIYRPPRGPVEYFDSFGLPPLSPETINYLSRIAPQGWTYSMTTVQHEIEDSCGQHCINFLKHRLSELPMSHVLEHLTHNKLKNDYIVKHSI
jgi:hypothetical protein